MFFRLELFDFPFEVAFLVVQFLRLRLESFDFVRDFLFKALGFVFLVHERNNQLLVLVSHVEQFSLEPLFPAALVFGGLGLPARGTLDTFSE